jgi:hypothetical protein
MIDTSVIDTVIFDWGGTLTPWNALDPHDAWRAYTEVAHADDAERAASVAAALLAADAARWATVRDEHRAFTLADVLADADVAHHDVAVDAYREFWAQVSHTDPEATPMLAALREQGLRLGVLSSTLWPAQWHEEWLRRDGVLDAFDACHRPRPLRVRRRPPLRRHQRREGCRDAGGARAPLRHPTHPAGAGGRPSRRRDPAALRSARVARELVGARS